MGRGRRDALSELLDSAPLDDEPTSAEEDEGVRDALAEIARGEIVSAEEVKRKIGDVDASAGGGSSAG